MTRDDIIRMAREAGFLVDETARQYQPNCIHHTWHMIDEGLERFATLVAAHEREECAKVCDPEPSLPNEAYTVLNNKATMRRCAAAIRVRGDT